MPELSLSCECGKVQGVARGVSPSIGNRVICYCNSCQQFPIKLGKASILDEYGGTEIYQLPPSQLEITTGNEHIRCLRHTGKGLHRFYAGCCNSPIANAPGLGLPFVGLIYSTDTEPEMRDEKLGPVRSHVKTHEATKPLPPERQGGMVIAILRILGQMVLWRLNGKARPHPFFDYDGRAVVKPEVR